MPVCFYMYPRESRPFTWDRNWRFSSTLRSTLRIRKGFVFQLLWCVAAAHRLFCFHPWQAEEFHHHTLYHGNMSFSGIRTYCSHQIRRLARNPCRDGTFPIEPASIGLVPAWFQSQKETSFFSDRFSETTEDAWKPPKNRLPHEMFTIQDVGKLVRSEGFARRQPLRARSVREVLGSVRFSLKSYLRQPYGRTLSAELNLGLPQELTPAALFPCLGFGKPDLEHDVICSHWSAQCQLRLLADSAHWKIISCRWGSDD